MTSRILFVCLGNICRSPTAEAVFRRLMPQFPCDSAGTSGWHVGEPPYGPMQKVAAARGIGLSDLRARQVKPEDFDAFDLIVAMDADNVRDLEALRPPGNRTRVRLLAPFAQGAVGDTVPDPYYTRDFDGTLDIIEAAARGLRDSLKNAT